MKIAVYNICKNEAKNVEGWLENTLDADYIVLADTGSTDGTLDIMEKFKNEPGCIFHKINVMPFRFDVARNTALALVPPDVDVCISLDLDERLSDNWRENLERGWQQVPGATKMGVMYHTTGLKPFWHNSRIHARSGYVWMDPCHEHIWPWMIEQKEIGSKSVSIHHNPDRSKPRTSYLPLLAAGLNEDPGKGRRMFYYAREMVVNKEYEIALGWFKKYLEAHEASGIEDWWESDQARHYIKLCEGVISEQQALRGTDHLV